MGLQTEFPYWSHLVIRIMTLSDFFLNPSHPMLEDAQSALARLMPKNGVQQMIKRPVTTATVVAIRNSWNQNTAVKLGRGKTFVVPCTFEQVNTWGRERNVQQSFLRLGICKEGAGEGESGNAWRCGLTFTKEGEGVSRLLGACSCWLNAIALTLALRELKCW